MVINSAYQNIVRFYIHVDHIFTVEVNQTTHRILHDLQKVRFWSLKTT